MSQALIGGSIQVFMVHDRLNYIIFNLGIKKPIDYKKKPIDYYKEEANSPVCSRFIERSIK